MVSINRSLGLWLCFICCFSYAQQITVDNTVSPQNLIENNLIQGCVEVSNINSPHNGNSIGLGSFGYFERGLSNFPFENGIVLTTGDANAAGNSENNATLNDGEDSWLTDPDLEAALGLTGTLNATSIEFNFISISNQIQFNYVLASEEYFGNFPCQYSDGFAFLIREAGSSDPYTNIAVIPGTTTPVNTNTVHDEIVGFCDASNEQYFEGYSLGDTNYNGRTSVLSVTAAIQPNVEYQIKLIIADQTDENYDSAVFIEGNSFNASVDLGEDISTCASDITLDGDIGNPLATYNWYYNDVLVPAPNNQTTLNVTETGNYRVEIEIPLAGNICVVEDDINITLSSTQSSDPISDYEICDDISNDDIETFDLSTKDAEVLASVPASNYNISYHYTNTEAQTGLNAINSPIQNTTNPQVIHVRIEDTDNGCLAFSTINLIVNPLPHINDPSPLEVCDDQIADGYTTIDLNIKNDEITNGLTNLIVTYHSTQTDAESGSNPLPMPYVNTNSNEQVFVRVEDDLTGCSRTTSLDISVLDNPVINTDDHYIDACDADHDGFANFDLTTIIPDVLQGLTGVSVTFHETNEDALSGSNPIADDTNYENIVSDEQTVYIRVESDATGCASVTPIEIHTNLLLTATDIDDVSLCDIDNDGIEEFNFLSIETSIINDLPFDISVDFYLTEDDRDNQTNALDKTVDFIPTSNPQTIYIGITSLTCYEVDQIDLILIPIYEFESIISQTVCDEDQDGLTTTDLSQFDSLVTDSENGYNITYFLTEDDARNNSNVLPNFYTNTTNPFRVYPRITSQATGCSHVNSFEITVLEAPITSTPSDIVICDNDQDGFYTINLLDVIPEVVSDTSDRQISFHTSQGNANSGANPITNESVYNAQTGSVYIRVENTITGCHSTETLSITVNTLPVFTAISNYKICEDNSDGFGDFIFNTKDTEILNGQPGKQVLYYLNQNDADNRTNAINKNVAYQNISNPQTIYVRVENLTDQDCYGTSSFTIEVGANPLFNEPADWFVCDDIANDGFETFDLTTKIAEVSQGIADNLTVTFYTSLYNAENSIDPLPLQYTNTVNPQTIFVQIDNGTICNSISSFELNVIQVPMVNESNPIVECDVDYDGLTEFDLTGAEIDILDVRQNNIETSYFESVAEAESNLNAIQNPEVYTNISNPQTVYLKVTNTISNCFVLVPIDLNVNIPPVVNDFQSYDICDNANNNFDLTEINDVIIDDNQNVLFSYFLTEEDANANENALDTDYTYSTNNDILFARLENTITNCYYVYEFNLIVNPLPIANQPSNLEACDDETNDGFATFDLETQTTSVLGAQDPSNFTVTYFTSPTAAANNNNPITNIYSGTHNEAISVRIENNETGCFNLTEFTLIVNPYPNVPLPLIECDTNYDGLTTFDLTMAEADLFEISNPNEVFSYFESMEDLEADNSPILNPQNYTNLSNPQTVFIRVHNTNADCYRSVPLELNVNLPPVINDFVVYDICDNDTNSFDLTEINTTIMDESFNVLFSYFSNEADAIANENALDTDYTYLTNNDTLYARVEFSTTHCYYIYEFNLFVNPRPIANHPNDLEACDDDFDGLLEFNLTQQNADILGGQNPSNFTVTYHNSEDEATDNLSALDTDYMAFDTEIIYARVENNDTGCFSLTQFSIIINPLPVIDIDDQVICLDNFPLVVSANTNYTTDTYLWSTGETTPEIEITEIGIYWVTVTTEFGCQNTRTFSVSESEAATIEATEVIDFSDPNNITVTISGIGNYLYQLDDGDPQESNVFENVGMGYHTVTIIDLNGCSEVTRDVLVIDIPKHMTPNNDGQFDRWHIVGVETLPGTIIHIFDRYGKHLTTLRHDTLGWDGTYNGHKLPASDYWFVANVVRGNQSFEVKGHFAIRR